MAEIQERTTIPCSTLKGIRTDPDQRASLVVNNLDAALERVVDKILNDERFKTRAAVITITAKPRVEKVGV